MSAASSADARRITRKTSYTRSFAFVAFSWALRCKGHYTQVRERLLRHWMDDCTNVIPFLAPRNQVFWISVLRDLLEHPAVRQRMADMTRKLHAAGDLISLSIDGEFKLPLHIKATRSRRNSRNRDATDESASSVLLTVKTSSSAWIAFALVETEDSNACLDVVTKSLSTEERKQIRHIAVDSPSRKMFEVFKYSLENFEILSLDPMHISFKYERAFPQRISEGARTLKLLMQKFGRPFKSTYRLDFAVFTGLDPIPFNATEQKWIDVMLSMSDDAKVASTHLKRYVDLEHAYGSRCEFIRCMAAFTTVYSDEMIRRTDKSHRVLDHIKHLCSPTQLGWLFNGPKFLHAYAGSVSPFCGIGTTANEALHAELKEWIRTPSSIHRCTLHLCLSYFMYGKLISHVRALTRRTTYQMRPREAMNYLSSSVCFTADWDGWCKSSLQHVHDIQREYAREMRLAKESARKLPAKGVRKRPACVPLGRMIRFKLHARRIRVIKRTVFTQVDAATS